MLPHQVINATNVYQLQSKGWSVSAAAFSWKLSKCWCQITWSQNEWIPNVLSAQGAWDTLFFCSSKCRLHLQQFQLCYVHWNKTHDVNYPLKSFSSKWEHQLQVTHFWLTITRSLGTKMTCCTASAFQSLTWLATGESETDMVCLCFELPHNSLCGEGSKETYKVLV